MASVVIPLRACTTHVHNTHTCTRTHAYTHAHTRTSVHVGVLYMTHTYVHMHAHTTIGILHLLLNWRNLHRKQKCELEIWVGRGECKIAFIGECNFELCCAMCAFKCCLREKSGLQLLWKPAGSEHRSMQSCFPCVTIWLWIATRGRHRQFKSV